MLLILPLPFTWRKSMFEFISNSPVIAKFQYGMKVSGPRCYRRCTIPVPVSTSDGSCQLRSDANRKLRLRTQITFIFILILFIDSVNRVYRVQREISDFGSQNGGRAQGVMGHERMEVQARKFYSQRNM